VRRADAGGVDSIHLDVMDGHFVDNITFGPAVIASLRPVSELPFHSHLMISQPLRYAERFADAGSDLLIFHAEADDDPGAVIDAIIAAGKRPGLAINPETPPEAAHRYLERIDLLLVMTVHPGWGGQTFLYDVLPKISVLRDEIARRALPLTIGVDGGVNRETIAPAFAAGGRVMVAGNAVINSDGDLEPVVSSLRDAALTGGAPAPTA
jgi:ribulose-phosphate 3-epimerase